MPRLSLSANAAERRASALEAQLAVFRAAVGEPDRPTRWAVLKAGGTVVAALLGFSGGVWVGDAQASATIDAARIAQQTDLTSMAIGAYGAGTFPAIEATRSTAAALLDCDIDS